MRSGATRFRRSLWESSPDRGGTGGNEEQFDEVPNRTTKREQPQSRERGINSPWPWEGFPVWN